jgi:hypothetical protein
MDIVIALNKSVSENTAAVPDSLVTSTNLSVLNS